jgi:hypothetical protein
LVDDEEERNGEAEEEHVLVAGCWLLVASC